MPHAGSRFVRLPPIAQDGLGGSYGAAVVALVKLCFWQYH